LTNTKEPFLLRFEANLEYTAFTSFNHILVTVGVMDKLVVRLKVVERLTKNVRLVVKKHIKLRDHLGQTMQIAVRIRSFESAKEKLMEVLHFHDL
jgi:hypothetical protein